MDRGSDNYAARLETMPDVTLRREWDEETGFRRRLVEQEMARRFRHPSPQQLYYINKFLDLAPQFMDAYNKKEWYRAKRIYDDAITVGLFLEIPLQLRREFFGLSDEDEGEREGMIPRSLVSRVYGECVVHDNLGHECVVYRIPGEVGFYGAQPRPGTRHMPAEENPSYWAREMDAVQKKGPP